MASQHIFLLLTIWLALVVCAENASCIIEDKEMCMCSLHPQCLLPPHTFIHLPVQASPCTPQPLIWGIRMHLSLSVDLQLAFYQTGMNVVWRRLACIMCIPFAILETRCIFWLETFSHPNIGLGTNSVRVCDSERSLQGHSCQDRGHGSSPLAHSNPSFLKKILKNLESGSSQG